MTVLAAEAAPIAAEALGGGGAAAAGESAAAGGAGEGAGKVASKISSTGPKAQGGRSPASRGSGSSGASKRGGGKGGKKGKGALGGLVGGGAAKSLTGGGGTAHKVVIAEFILCVILIGLTPILMRKPNNGHLYVPNDFVRLSAVCILFFALALLSNGKRSARFAAAFGALVSLGVLYNATGSLNALGAIFTNAHKNKGTVTVASASKDEVQMPEYKPVDLGGVPVQQAAGGGASLNATPATSSGSGGTVQA